MVRNTQSIVTWSLNYVEVAIIRIQDGCLVQSSAIYSLVPQAILCAMYMYIERVGMAWGSTLRLTYTLSGHYNYTQCLTYCTSNIQHNHKTSDSSVP